MARTPRHDAPGAWHHVMNRGLARRSVFEDRACQRYFLSRVARVVRSKQLEVHAFCVLTTHFHLLVRSPSGSLSEAMRRVQNEYVRWFNRRNRRDGPLFRGRFLSRPVDGQLYFRVLVRYIDQNAPRAGLARSPEGYKYGSARHYARGTGPRWLTRDRVEQDACRLAGAASFTWSAYLRAYGGPVRADEAELVQRRLEHDSLEPDPLDDLVGAAPDAVLAWMNRKAALADGSSPGLPCAAAPRVSEACELERARDRPAARPRRSALARDRATLRRLPHIGQAALRHPPLATPREQGISASAAARGARGARE